jgi:peptidoglycan-N-acetylglucosamine deacetylase
VSIPTGTDGAVSRRAMLLLSVAAGAASGAPAALGPVRPQPTGRHVLTAATHPPAWARRWRSPISRLDDFTHRSPSTHFARRAVMLTIDDGPSAEWTPKYLGLLKKHHVQATFCMIGSQVHPNRHLARSVVEHGHVIANHSWTHDEQLPSRTTARIRSEIERTSHAIHAATGFVPSQYRAPGGSWGPRIYDELARQQLMPLGWDIDPRDWARPGTAAIESVMLRARQHDIILCHDGGGDRGQTYRALETVIPALLHRGYEFVTLPAPQPRGKSIGT